CPGSDTAYADQNCVSKVPDYSGIEIISCPAYGQVSFTQTPAAGAVINGDTIVEIIVSNNIASDTCEFPLIFTDTITPSLSGPDTLTVTMDQDCRYIVPSVYNLVTVTENCSSVTIEQSPLPGTE